MAAENQTSLSYLIWPLFPFLITVERVSCSIYPKLLTSFRKLINYSVTFSPFESRLLFSSPFRFQTLTTEHCACSSAFDSSRAAAARYTSVPAAGKLYIISPTQKLSQDLMSVFLKKQPFSRCSIVWSLTIIFERQQLDDRQAENRCLSLCPVLNYSANGSKSGKIRTQHKLWTTSKGNARREWRGDAALPRLRNCS